MYPHKRKGFTLRWQGMFKITKQFQGDVPVRSKTWMFLDIMQQKQHAKGPKSGLLPNYIVCLSRDIANLH